ncbi:Protein of unknown function DUF58 [Pedococcus dokdonensis]|uniref:DUF58 domain-containing protein n=1 Tax=Pedococcus dokdonensis TaxID=443156 RepID=A0A1H0UVW5_9MICO|nr:DUF58 domain-containing protein [Pedococcus dokdonensis]SDP70048.1 Protein of unknown function DUF58 [Pedococcus dokdonensis]
MGDRTTLSPGPPGPGTLTAESLLRRLEWRVVRRLDGRLQGDYRTLFRGTGIDFTDLREYEPGDDLRHIDWNVTARMDTPYVREYVEDREITAWLLLDRSASMGFGPVDRQKSLVLAEIATTIAHILARGGNSVGAVLFDGDVATIPPAQGRRQVLRISQALLQPPAAARPKDTTDLSRMLHATLGLARRRSLLVIVSDFITQPGWEHPLSLLTRRHDVVAIQVVDPRESELPAVGMVYVEDAETGEQIFVDTNDPVFRERLAAAAAERQDALVAAARRAGTDIHPVATDDDLVRALARISELRRRRRR